ncbi:MAG: hypothetical protein K2K44_06700 [Oscillospiraceae bacterium]|nr:hypothetical protein [Oscillospiraceae bacterium]
MSNRIDDIMQLSDNGYIEEYYDIEVILEHFLNYTMEELNNVLPQNHKILDFAANIAIRLGNIDITDTSQIEKITLSDLLCIMEYFEKTRHETEEALLSYMKYLRNSIAYLKGLPWATLFMSISVNSLMSFFHEKTNDRKYSKIYREICELSGLYGEHGISYLSTVKQLFDDTVGALFSSWNPGFNKDEYFSRIENCCLILKRLFVDGIAKYYYTNFNFFEFLKKYNLTEIPKN